MWRGHALASASHLGLAASLGSKAEVSPADSLLPGLQLCWREGAGLGLGAPLRVCVRMCSATRPLHTLPCALRLTRAAPHPQALHMCEAVHTASCWSAGVRGTTLRGWPQPCSRAPWPRSAGPQTAAEEGDGEGRAACSGLRPGRGLPPTLQQSYSFPHLMLQGGKAGPGGQLLKVAAGCPLSLPHLCSLIGGA